MTVKPGTFKHKADCSRPDLQVSVAHGGTKQNCPDCLRYIFVPPGTPERDLSLTQTRALASDLIRALAPLAGDAPAVRTELLRWLDVLDAHRLAMVCMALTQEMFTSCLTKPPEGTNP